MRAWHYDEFGGPNVLHLGELPDPAVDAGQVRVRVTAAGVNPADYKLRSGFGAALPHRSPIIPGMDIAGTVDALGSQVAGLSLGQRVFGYIGLPFLTDGGSWAERTSLPAAHLVPIPDNVSDETAAALPCAGLTALLMANTLHISEGDNVLVHAASGGVGHLFTQLCTICGAHVVGTASPRNHDYLRSLGAEPVDYTNGLAALRRPFAAHFDAVADFYGSDAIEQSLHSPGPKLDSRRSCPSNTSTSHGSPPSPTPAACAHSSTSPRPDNSTSGSPRPCPSPTPATPYTRWKPVPQPERSSSTSARSPPAHESSTLTRSSESGTLSPIR